MRYFLRLEYDGGHFCGWQRQPDRPSVQETVERALATLLRHEVAVVGAGRTDAGVHARRLGVHFDSDVAIEPQRFTRSLNALLGPAVAATPPCPVDARFHARYSATQRRYAYRVLMRKSPWWQGRAWHCPYRVDWERVRTELTVLAGEHDFTTFCAAGSGAAHNRCRIVTAHIDTTHHPFVLTIAANRFVYRMVRSLVGTVVDIGRGACDRTLAALLEARDRRACATTAPPHGLTLEDVLYPGDDPCSD